MTILEKIKSNSRINVDEIITLLTKQLNVSDEGIEQLNYSLYATLQIILNSTNRNYIIEDMFCLWVDMTKDYWFLNGYDKKYNKSNSTDTNEQNNANDIKIKSIKRGDTETTFMDPKNQTTINGVTYQTGTINFDEDTLTKKYMKQMYKFRKLGKRKGW